jgi:hypothetical protein
MLGTTNVTNPLTGGNMMQFNTPTDKYHVTSHGNGWAYEVYCNRTGGTLWFQDHDADFLRSNTEDLTDEDALDLMFAMLCE